MIIKLKDYFINVVSLIKKPEMAILPGQLAFFLVLSVIPLIAVIASVVSHFSLSVDALIDLVNSSLPEDVASFVVQALSGKNINFNIILFYIASFILASNGPHSMIIGSNIIYNTKNKGFLHRRVKALVMTMVLVLLVIFMLLVPAYGSLILELTEKIIGSNQLMETINLAFNILKIPVSFILIFLCIKILYTIAPDLKIKSKTTTNGALFTTILWIICTEIYAFYVRTFTQYNLFYGSIANIIILLLWIYILSYIFVLGILMNVANKEKN